MSNSHLEINMLQSPCLSPRPAGPQPLYLGGGSTPLRAKTRSRPCSPLFPSTIHTAPHGEAAPGPRWGPPPQSPAETEMGGLTALGGVEVMITEATLPLAFSA